MDSQSTFFRPGGTLEPGAECYIARKADEQLLSALLRGEYVFLLDSRQKGKSSLIARSILKLREAGVRQVKLDLQRIGANVTPEQWYAGLAVGVGQELGLHAKVLEYWQERQAVGPLARFVGVLQDVILPNTTEPLVIFVDEVDFVRALTFPTDEFFAAIRESFNRRSSDDSFKRLTFCLVGVATPGQLIRNPDISPFNIGLRIDLTDFTLEETLVYSDSLNGKRDGAKLVARVHHWVSGHPYLTQLLCGRIANEPGVETTADVDRLVRTLFLSPESRQREPNLSDVERRMLDPDVPGLTPEERRVQVLELYGRMLRAKSVEAVEQNPVVATLRLSGVGLEHDGVLQVRNLVYRTVFDETWRRQNLPDAEVRRQAGASRRATFRTAAIAGLALLAVSAGSFGMWRLANEREQALVKLQARTNDLKQVSDERQSALTDLQVRTEDLKRTSSEREAALGSLGQRNRELTKLSAERQAAISGLQTRTEDLKRVSSERERTLASLEQLTDELRQKNYVGLMASIRLGMQDNRWMRVAELIDQAKTNPLRGWEWGHLARMMSGHVAEVQLGTLRTELEREPDGSLSLVTPDSIYKVTTAGLQLHRKFRGRTILPFNRNGDLRLGIDAATGRYVLRDVKTDEIVMQSDIDVISYDAPSKTVVVYRGDNRTEKRSFDGKTLAVYERGDPNLAQSQKLSNGDEIMLFRDGLITRTDSSGKRLAESRVTPAPRITPQYLRISKDGSLLVHVDGVVPRPLQVRRTSDLSVVVTLAAPASVGSAVTFAPDKRSILVGSNGVVVRYDLATGKAARSYYGHKSAVRLLAFLPGGESFVSVERSGVLRVWPLDPAPVVQQLGTIADPPTDLWICDDPQFLVYPTVSGALESRDLRTGEVARLEEPAGNFGGQAMLSVVSGTKVFVGNTSGALDRLSVVGLRKEKSVQLFDGPVTGTLALPGKRLLVTSDLVGGHTAAKFAIVDTDSLTVQHRFTPDWPLPGVNYGRGWFTRSDGPLFALVANRQWKGPLMPSAGVIRLVSSESGKILRKMEFPGETIDASALSADGSRLFVSFRNRLSEISSRVTVFDTATGKQIGSLKSPNGGLIHTFYRKGDLLLGSMADMNIAVWDLGQGPEYKVLSPGQRIVFYDISPNRDRILTALADGSVMIWDAKAGEELYALQASPPDETKPAPGAVSAQSVFSKDGAKIVVYDGQGVLRSFDSIPRNVQPKAAAKKGP